MKTIGLSLPRCIADICEGKRDEHDVLMIISSTICTTEDDWWVLYEIYNKYYWREYPEQAFMVLLRLYQNNKIYQPMHYLQDFFKEFSQEHWIDANVSIIIDMLDSLMRRLHEIRTSTMYKVISITDAKPIIEGYKQEIDNIIRLIRLK